MMPATANCGRLPRPKRDPTVAATLPATAAEIAEMDDARIREAMNRWGLYYRPRALKAQKSQDGTKTGSDTE